MIFYVLFSHFIGLKLKQEKSRKIKIKNRKKKKEKKRNPADRTEQGGFGPAGHPANARRKQPKTDPAPRPSFFSFRFFSFLIYVQLNVNILKNITPNSILVIATCS
jgi:hypothetical protein